jgi:hypothetical protein
MTLVILFSLAQIIAALAIVGTALLSASLWWALCQRLAEASDSTSSPR